MCRHRYFWLERAEPNHWQGVCAGERVGESLQECGFRGNGAPTRQQAQELFEMATFLDREIPRDPPPGWGWVI